MDLLNIVIYLDVRQDGHRRTLYYKSIAWKVRVCLRRITPALHIKLGLMKSFVKAMNQKGHDFLYLKTVFPKSRDAKLTERIFVEPQMRSLMKGLNAIEKITENFGYH